MASRFASSYTKVCSTCGATFTTSRSYHFRCLDCWKREQEHEVYSRGYRDGLAEGRREGEVIAATKPAALEPGLLLDIVKLTHPDRHPAERRELATRVTARMLALRERVTP